MITIRPSRCQYPVSFHPLSAGRQPGNNKVLAFYGTEYEAFLKATDRLMERFRGVIPEGAHQARIRCSRRETRDPTSVGQGTLADTLGEEACGLVLIDPSGGHPLTFNEMDILENAVATTNARIELEVAPRSSAAGIRDWRRTGSYIDTQEELGDQWHSDIASGAKHILELTHVTASDEHYARCRFEYAFSGWPLPRVFVVFIGAHPYTFDWMHVFGLMYTAMVRDLVVANQEAAAFCDILRTAPVFKTSQRPIG